MNKIPLLSIIVPVYKRVNRLKRALDSVLTQLEKSERYEIIICDDSDKDYTVEQFIHEQYTENTKIKYFRNLPPVGSGFLNFAYAAKNYASGEWVVTLSDDDYFFDDSLKRLLNAIKSDPNLEYIFLDCANDYGFGRVFDYDKELDSHRLNAQTLCKYPAMELVFALKREILHKLPVSRNGAFGSYLWTDYVLCHLRNLYLPRFGYAYEVSGENFNKHKRYIKELILGLQLFEESFAILDSKLTADEILHICRVRFEFFLNSASLIKGLYECELRTIYGRVEEALKTRKSLHFLREIAKEYELKYQARIETEIQSLQVLQCRYEANQEKILVAKNIIIYGAAHMGRELQIGYERESKNVICFIDDNLAGEHINGVEVVALEKADFDSVDAVVLASGRFDYLDKMKRRLIKHGVNEEKILGLL